MPADRALAGDDRSQGGPGAPRLDPGLPEPFRDRTGIPPVDAGDLDVEPGGQPDRAVPELLRDPGHRRHLRRGHHAGRDLPPHGDFSFLPEADDSGPSLCLFSHILDLDMTGIMVKPPLPGGGRKYARAG